jgi:SnoaL-like domain
MTTNDILEIQNLVAAYCITTDNADVDGFMNCWVKPEEFGGYDSGAFGSLKTWQELKDFEAHHVGENGDAKGKRHQATNVIIKVINENEVLVTNDMLVFEVENIPTLVATGRYDDSVVVRTENGWKFKSRKLHIDSGYFKLVEQWKSNK